MCQNLHYQTPPLIPVDTVVTFRLALVAAVAVHAVVDVPAHAPMLVVRLRLGVAVGALEDGVVVRIRVTCAAHAICIAVIDGEPGVVKGGSQPTGSGVAGGAGCGKAGGNVIRIGRALVVSFVATVAIRGHGRVVVVHVATGTRDGRMRTGQRKGRVVVIKRGRGPRGGAVANIALLRESGAGVVWIGGVLVIRQVTGDARGAGQAVVAVHMALAALQRGVSTGESPAG